MTNALHRVIRSKKNAYNEVKFLIEVNKLDVNRPDDKYRERPIEFAAEFSDIETFKYLVEEAHANVEVNDKINLLDWAAVNSEPIERYIAETNLVEKFNDDTTSLHAWAAAGDLVKVNELLDAHPDWILKKNKQGITPLYYAASSGKHSIVHFMTNHAAFKAIDDNAKLDDVLRGYGARALYNASNKHDTILIRIYAYQEAINIFKQILNKVDEDYRSLSICYLELLKATNRTSDKILILEKLIHYHEKLIVIKQYNVLLLAKAYYRTAEGCALDHSNDEANNYLKKTINLLMTGPLKYTPVADEKAKLLNQANEMIDLINKKSALVVQSQNYGFSCKDVPNDGDCFFHAVFHQLQMNKLVSGNMTQEKLRLHTVNHIARHFDDYKPFINEDDQSTYLEIMSKHSNHATGVSGTWVDQIAMLAFARRFNVTLAIIRNDGAPPTIIKRPHPCATLYIGYEVELHYQSLIRIPDVIPELSIDQYIESANIDSFTFNTNPTDKKGKRTLEDSGNEGAPLKISRYPNGLFSHGFTKGEQVNNSECDYDGSKNDAALSMLKLG